jgi:hypothetical protein
MRHTPRINARRAVTALVWAAGCIGLALIVSGGSRVVTSAMGPEAAPSTRAIAFAAP